MKKRWKADSASLLERYADRLEAAPGFDAESAETLLRAARGADKALISEVGLFDVYEGKGVAKGKKSVAIAVTLQPRDRTLTDEDIEKVSAAIVAAVEKQTGGVLRG